MSIPSLSRPYRILQVIPTMNAGGAERSCIDVTAAITKAGHQAVVVTQSGVWSAEITRAGGTLINLPVKSKNPFVMWRNAHHLAKIIRDYDIDIVHARSRAPAWSAYWAAKRVGVPFMTTFHAVYSMHNRFKKYYNSVMVRGVRVIANSKYVAQHIQDEYGIDPKHIHVIYRGTPVERFHPNLVQADRIIQQAKEWQLPEDKHLILLPSRMTRVKGHRVLLQALAKLERSDYICIMCGMAAEKNRYQDELVELIHQLNLQEHVRLVPSLKDVPAGMHLAQVMIAPTITPEAFGRMPVEAQAAGTPVIASAIGGHIETIIHGETGFLFPVEDSDSLAEAIRTVLNMTDVERTTMANRAMSHAAAHFGLEQMTSQTLQVYDEIMADRIKSN